MNTVFDFKVTSIDGKEISLSGFRGKKLLIVNTASECGFTPQYGQLQWLHEHHGDKVTVLGFPSNDFGAQEPGTDAEIKNFCSKNYGVAFPMFGKIPVKGDEAHPLFKWLAQKSGEQPNWNFAKYLVDESGTQVKFISPALSPADEGFLALL
ncbi:MAG TPA: glutathione peroxidase [Bacteroidia bacterium]|jgi:glutathione peroxidase